MRALPDNADVYEREPLCYTAVHIFPHLLHVWGVLFVQTLFFIIFMSEGLKVDACNVRKQARLIQVYM